MSEVSFRNILAFGNIVYSEGKAPDTIAPRLDFRERDEVVEDGQADLFRALQWRYQMAPTLQGRERDLQSILDWAEAGGNTISVRLLSGAGGSGKTRLAAEAARILRSRGWAAGFVPRAAKDTQTVETDLRKFLLIFDYPEERMEVLRGLFEAIRDIPNCLVEFPIRILLVSRREIGEWQDMARRSNISLGRQELAHLSALDVAQAEAMFAEAAHHFAALTGGAVPFCEGLQDWLATEAARRVPLVVMAAAIHTVLTGRGGFGLGAAELINDLASREITRAANVSKNAGLSDEALPRLIALAAMARTGLSDAQCVALADLDLCEARGQSLIDRLKGTPWRRRAPETGLFGVIRPEPDRMAASFVAQVLLDDPAIALPDWIAEVATPQGGGFGDVVSRVGHDLLGNTPRWFRALETTLEQMIAQRPERVAAFTDMAFKAATAFSASFAEVVIRTMLGRDDWDESARATLLNNLSNHLSDLGRRKEALGVAQEAVDLRRALAAARPDAFTPNLAGSQTNLGRCLSALGRREEALAVAQEAVDLYRALAAARADAFMPDLAGSLNNLANFLSDLGQREEALAAAQEAVDLRRALAAARPDAFTPDLAMSLSNLAIRLSDLGRREEALGVAQEAVDLRRALAAARADAFTPDLASSLNNLANYLSALGRREEALAVAQEAVDLRRALAAARADAFMPDLAGSLNNLGEFLGALGRREEALGVAQEAVDLYRALAAARPDAFTPDLAKSLTNLANRLSDLGMREEALGVAQEAVDLRRALAAARPDAFTPDLAMSLNILANRLSDLGRREEALGVAQEAVDLRRALAAARPDAFTPDLAMSLHNLANRLSDLGQLEEALGMAQEAVDLCRALAAARPDAFTPNLAMSMTSLAIRLGALGRREEALGVVQEAVDLRRALAAARPDAFTPALAASLNNLAIFLRDLGRCEEALGVAQEAVDLRRALAKARPRAFSVDLSISLGMFSDLMIATNNKPRALDTITEAITVLMPTFVAMPQAVAQWMDMHLQRYFSLCEGLEREPDEAWLRPVLEVFARLQQVAGEDVSGE